MFFSDKQTKKSRFFDFFREKRGEKDSFEKNKKKKKKLAFFIKKHTNIKHVVVLLKREEETKRRDDDDDEEEEKKSVNYVFFALSVRVWSHGGGFHDVSL